MKKNTAKYIILTRPAAETKIFKTQLETLGLKVISYPTIKITPNTFPQTTEKYLHRLDSFDWIIFTSQNGIKYFMQSLKQRNIDPQILKTKQLAAVGSQTAEEGRRHNLHIQMIPTKFTTADLAAQIPIIPGQKVLLPRADIASPTLKKQLQTKGAIVVNIPIYKTQYTTNPTQKLKSLIENNQISCITFTSPSTIRGFMKNLKDALPKGKILEIPILSIGPITTKAAQKYGFIKIKTASQHTIEGMIEEIKEIVI